MTNPITADEINAQLAELERQIADAMEAGEDTTALTTQYTTLKAQLPAVAILANRAKEAQKEAERGKYLIAFRGFCQVWKEKNAEIAAINTEITTLHAQIEALTKQAWVIRPDAQTANGRIINALQRAADHGFTVGELSAIWREYQS